MPGADASGLPQAGPPDDGRSVAAAGMETSWRTERQQLKPGQNTRQSSDSQLADRPPDSLSGLPGSCRTSGGLDPRKFRSRKFCSRAPNPRSWPCGGCQPYGWNRWTGRWWVAGASCCGCSVSMSAPAIRSGRIAAGVGRSRGAEPRSGRCRHRRGQPPRCARRPHARGSRRHSLTSLPGRTQQALVGGDDRLPHSPTRAGRRRRGRHLRPIPAESTPAAVAEPRMTTDPGLAKLRPCRVG